MLPYYIRVAKQNTTDWGLINNRRLLATALEEGCLKLRHHGLHVWWSGESQEGAWLGATVPGYGADEGSSMQAGACGA